MEARTKFDLAAYVEAQAHESGVPLKVQDAATIAKAARLAAAILCATS